MQVEVYKEFEVIDEPQTAGALIKNLDYTQFIARFLDAQDVKDNSKQTYGRALKQFFIWTSTNVFGEISRLDILNYKNFLLNTQKISPNTATNYLVAVRKFFSYLESEKVFPDIAKTIKGAKRAKGFRKGTLTVSQVKDTLTGIDRTTIEGLRDFAIINLLIRTGLRTVEIQRALIGDLKQEGGEAVLFIQGKGRDTKDEFVLLTDETLKPIREYLRLRPNAKDEEALFSSLSNKNKGEGICTRSIRRIVKGHLDIAGINDKRLTAHSLRHTAVTFALLGGATLQEAQTLARHSNINTTLIYAQNLNRVKSAPERKIDSYLNF